VIVDINLSLILLAALVAMASPGPAILAIAGTSMRSGRRSGLALALGITTGSIVWSLSAALGLGALMMANAWVMEVIRYCGSAYLLFLAFKSAKSAFTPGDMKVRPLTGDHVALYAKGVALHVTNPKAILFFGSLYSIGIPSDASASQLATVIVAVGILSFVIFHGYALLFSTPLVTRQYLRLRRWFEAAFAVGFGLASLKVLTARLP